MADEADEPLAIQGDERIGPFRGEEFRIICPSCYVAWSTPALPSECPNCCREVTVSFRGANAPRKKDNQ
jgi:hypothetical protein